MAAKNREEGDGLNRPSVRPLVPSSFYDGAQQRQQQRWLFFAGPFLVVYGGNC